MMTLLHRLARMLLLLAVWSAGVVLLVSGASERARLALVQPLAADRLLLVSSGAALVFGGIVFALSGLSRRRPGHFLSYERNGGAVSISTDAIGEYVGKLATEFPSVIRMRPRVVPGRKSIDVIVDTKVKAGPQIHEVCELLQQRVRETLTEGLGISELGRIEISVSEIVSEHRPS